jgi:hypothetical protein
MSVEISQTRLFRLVILMPIVAAAVFFAGSTVEAQGPPPNTCMYASQIYSPGACVDDGCWWWQSGQKCTHCFGGVCEWSTCNGCDTNND